MSLSIKENYIEAIKYGSPEYVPLSYDNLWHGISFDDMLKHEDWTDRFGITWEMGMKGVSPFPKINPLADIEKQLDGYKFPDPNGLVMNPDALSHLKTIDRDKFLVRGYIYYFFIPEYKYAFENVLQRKEDDTFPQLRMRERNSGRSCRHRSDCIESCTSKSERFA